MSEILVVNQFTRCRRFYYSRDFNFKPFKQLHILFKLDKESVKFVYFHRPLLLVSQDSITLNESRKRAHFSMLLIARRAVFDSFPLMEKRASLRDKT